MCKGLVWRKSRTPLGPRKQGHVAGIYWAAVSGPCIESSEIERAQFVSGDVGLRGKNTDQGAREPGFKLHCFVFPYHSICKVGEHTSACNCEVDELMYGNA